MKKITFTLFTTIFLLLIIAPCKSQSNSPQVTISVVADSAAGLAAKHGLNKVITALKAKGVAVEQAASREAARGKIVLLAGLASGSGAAARLLKHLKIAPPTGAESLLTRHVNWDGKKVLLVSGADDRGLMYALLDVADRIGWAADAKNPLSEVRDAMEQTYKTERELSIYKMQRASFESRFFKMDYCARRFRMLAGKRFYSFDLIFR